jgi:hypothetical protein
MPGFNSLFSLLVDIASGNEDKKSNERLDFEIPFHMFIISFSDHAIRTRF